jgi:dTDP-4-amino-4,6-dideoxygalactose transaminase
MNSDFNFSRRRFFEASALAGIGLGLGLNGTHAAGANNSGKPAILGGTKSQTGSFPGWPIFDESEEKAMVRALRSGKWGRLIGTNVSEFEKAFARISQAKFCVATSCGTTALLTTLGALGIGPGDEVILPPYTFIATYNAIVFHYALPVFVDTNPESFQIDAKKIPSAITAQTKAILPVHIGGSAADMEMILEGAKEIPVIEDACQAHLAEWRGRVVGNGGLAGCFSFQASKNLTSGEGGAIISNNEEFANRCYNFHNHGHGRAVGGTNISGGRGANFRMTEFQGALLLAQLNRLEQQAKIRDANAAYLAEMLSEIPGIETARRHEGCTRSSNHLFMFRYRKEHFANLPRAKFNQALSREGVPCSSGYAPLNTDKYVKALAENPHYLKIYGAETMSKWQERNRCPVNDQLCAEAVWFTQTTLLGTRLQMEQIAKAIRKIQKSAGDIVRA